MLASLNWGRENMKGYDAGPPFTKKPPSYWHKDPRYKHVIKFIMEIIMPVSRSILVHKSRDQVPYPRWGI